MQPSPDQWLPLANATTTDMFHNITSNSNNNSSGTSPETMYPETVPDVSGKDWTFRLLLVVLFCLCAKPRIPDERYHRRRRSSQTKKEDPADREERIEQSLTVKKVVTADAQGGLTLGEHSMTDTDNDTDIESDAGDDHSMEEENEEASTCIICLEPFRVGDTVAWSKQSTLPTDKTDCTEQPCLHVFHRDCIVPWLTNPKHNDCPACRSIILQDSHGHCPDESSLIEDDDEDLEAPSNNSIPFVIIHGLVSRVHHASCSLIAGQSSIDMSLATGTPDSCVKNDDDDDANRLSSVPQL
jgi:hypothetical protein